MHQVSFFFHILIDLLIVITLLIIHLLYIYISKVPHRIHSAFKRLEVRYVYIHTCSHLCICTHISRRRHIVIHIIDFLFYRICMRQRKWYSSLRYAVHYGFHRIFLVCFRFYALFIFFFLFSFFLSLVFSFFFFSVRRERFDSREGKSAPESKKTEVPLAIVDSLRSFHGKFSYPA